MFFEFVFLALAAPVGMLIAWLARDELVLGRKWFVSIVFLGIIGGTILLLNDKISSGLTCFFASLIASISYWKSFDKRWTSKKI